MTTTTHAQAAVPAAIHPAYDPTPSIPRLITELVQEDFWARYAQVRGDAAHFDPGYLASREQSALLLRAVIADLFALADPANPTAAADAAAAANAARRKSWLTQLSAETARAWLRDAYEEWRNDEPHPPNCPGHCRGSGIVMQTTTWQDDGAPLWAEPADCRRGEEDDPHAVDCACHGTGQRWNAERREYELCDRYLPDPAGAEREPAPTGAWHSCGPYGEEPF
ncbi:hypothetical protein [Streptomyces lutosisoli]|uniref:Phage protein n=1 Tax=Streptomyces lutosisoli TaxID=2665721 RepID=A0ABW2VUJ2_9ACTN